MIDKRSLYISFKDQCNIPLVSLNTQIDWQWRSNIFIFVQIVIIHLALAKVLDSALQTEDGPKYNENEVFEYCRNTK